MSIISIIINQAMSIYRSGVLVIDYLTTLVATVAGDVWNTLVHNWPYLLASVVVASLVQVYVSADHLATWLRRRTWVAILGAVALGALTPFCSCGTTAIVLGAMASSVPWAPIVAFLVSSPLTSPEEYVLSVGLFGPAFATTFFVAAIAAGLIGGGASWWLESRGLLAGQARMAAPGSASSCGGACEQQPGDGTGGRRCEAFEQRWASGRRLGFADGVHPQRPRLPGARPPGYRQVAEHRGEGLQPAGCQARCRRD